MRFCKTIIFILIISFVTSGVPSKAFAKTEKKVLNFVTSTAESTFIDVTLYTLFKELGYEISVTSVGMTTGLQMVDSGEKDGLVAQTQYFDNKQYENLVSVPESISSIAIVPIVKADFNERVTSWDEVDRYRVGYLYQQPYVESRISNISKYSVQKNTLDELYELLYSDIIDIIIIKQPANTGISLPAETKALAAIEDLETYTYLNKEYAHLISDAANILLRMKNDGTIDNIINNKQNYYAETKLVLNITSFYPDMIWERDLKRGLKTVFQDSDETNLVYSANLNSKGIISDENRKKSIYDNIRASFISRRPNLLLVSDINALKFTEENYYAMFKDIPVVFCGVNKIDTAIVDKMNENFTGFVETISAKETVSLMLDLFPETKRIFVINDYFEKGASWRNDIDEQLMQFADNITIEHNKNVPINELLSTIRKLPEYTLILTGFYFLDSNNIYYSQNELQTLISENATMPVFGLLSSSLVNGQVGGKYIDGFTQQLAAANMAKDILAGKDISELPVQYNTEEYNEWRFDYNALKKHGILEGKLPKNAIIENKPLPIYKSHPNETFFVIVIAVVIITALFILSILATKLRHQNTKLIETQKDLHSAEELILKDTEIKEIKERLEKIISTAPVFYMFVVGGVVVEINDYAKRHIGIDINDTADNLFTSPFLKAEVDNKLKSNTFVELKSENLNMKDGTVRRFHLNIAKYMFKNEISFILWGIDVEETEVQRDIINKSQKELKVLIDGLPMSICLINLNDNNIVYANNSFLNMFKYENLGDVENFDIKKLLHVFENNKLEEGQIFTNEIQFTSSDAKAINTIVVTSLMQYNGQTCYVSVFTDIAEEKKRAELLLNAAEKEKEANKLKSRFLVNMSHEIRTPMNAIIGLSQLALMKPQTRENNELFRKINVSSKNLLSIINDILDFSKIEAGKLELAEDEFNLEDIVANSFMVASERIENKKIEMLLNMSPDVNFNLIGDKTRLWQILKNVLDNSAKYTMAGRIILNVSNSDNKRSDGKTNITFVIEDTGLGMREEHVKQLFTPFVQFHNKGGAVNTGTGLGMSIIKQLVDLMGGEIEVYSKEGVGTTTKIKLSFKQQKQKKTMQQVLNKSELENRRILVVDDDPRACEIMSNLLEIAGIITVCVSNCDEAINLVKENDIKGTPFSIIILDYMLGQYNGIDLAKQINKISTIKSKLLMVSAYSKQIIANDIREAGFSDIIEKPFVPSYFIHQLNSTLSDEHTVNVTNYEKFNGARVILCEDNVLNQEVAIGMLDSFGIVPFIAENGLECLDMLEKDRYDLIFMDILMPIKDGRQTTAQIRNSDKPYKDIPIIAMTANVMKDDVQEYFAEGMNGHIGKPLSFEDINKYLKQFLPKDKKDITEQKKDLNATEEQCKGLPDEIKYEEGIARFGGKKDRYIKVLLKFAQELEQDIMPFEKAFSEQNINESTIFIHTLKGVSGNLGIERLFVAVSEFEATLRNGSPDPGLYLRVAEERKRAKNEIERRFTDKSDVEEAKVVGTDEEFMKIVKEMREALENSDPLTCEKLLATLKTKRWEGMSASEIAELEVQISDYNFYNAELILEKYH